MDTGQHSEITAERVGALQRRLQWRIHLANTINPKTGAPYPDSVEVPQWSEKAATFLPVGWVLIVDELDEKIAKLAPNYHLHQAKEKFGGLRYYLANTPANVTSEIN